MTPEQEAEDRELYTHLPDDDAPRADVEAALARAWHEVDTLRAACISQRSTDPNDEDE